MRKISKLGLILTALLLIGMITIVSTTVTLTQKLDFYPTKRIILEATSFIEPTGGDPVDNDVAPT